MTPVELKEQRALHLEDAERLSGWLVRRYDPEVGTTERFQLLEWVFLLGDA